MPKKASIFHAKVLVMKLALEIMTENEPDIYIIFSDSLSVLTTLKAKTWPTP